MEICNATWIVGGLDAAQTLTASYATDSSTRAHSLGGEEQIILGVFYTPKAGQSNRNLTIKAEVSMDGGTTWGTDPIGVDGAVSSNVITTQVYDREYKMLGATGGTTYFKYIPLRGGIFAMRGALLRVQVKEDGSANFGTVKVQASDC